MVYVLNWDANPKGDKDSGSASEPEQRVDAEEVADVDESFLAPASSAQRAQFSFASVDMTMGANRPMHLSGDRNQAFPLPESLSFEEHANSNRTYYPATAEYSDDYGHGPLKTPVTSTMVSPTDQISSFEYLTPIPFTPLTTAGQVNAHHPVAMPMQHAVSYCGSWTPTCQNVFSTMSYGADAHQDLTHPAMSYPVAIPSASYARDMPHDVPDLVHRTTTSFRPGS